MALGLVWGVGLLAVGLDDPIHRVGHRAGLVGGEVLGEVLVDRARKAWVELTKMRRPSSVSTA